MGIYTKIRLKIKVHEYTAQNIQCFYVFMMQIKFINIEYYAKSQQ